MPTTTCHAPGIWRNTFPAAAIWCETAPNDRTYWAETYQRHGYLSPSVTDELQDLITQGAESDPLAPARAWEALSVPVGDYTVRYQNADEAETEYEFRIHLVRDGSLEGKKIIKRKTNGVFRGFGFITRTGGFSLWARFARDIDAEYVDAAVHLIRALALNVNGADGERDLTGRDSMGSMLYEQQSAPIDFFGDDRSLTIEVHHRCVMCNLPATNLSDSDASVAYCDQHATVIPEPAPLFEVVGTAVYDDGIRMPTDEEVRRNLRLSELGTGEIQ